MTFYGPDLSYIHHAGFGSFAEQAAPWILETLCKAGFQSGLIVDLACGSGIWAARATAVGFGVVGIDASPAMIDLARAHAPAATFLVASAHAVEIPPCVAVTALGEGITYLPEGADQLDLASLLSRAADALAPGGLLLFDVIERRPEAPMRYQSSREGPDWAVAVDVREDPTRSVLERTIRVRRGIGSNARHSVETHRLLTFDLREIVQMVQFSGFDVTCTRAYGRLALPPQRIGIIAYRQPRE